MSIELRSSKPFLKLVDKTRSCLQSGLIRIIFGLNARQEVGRYFGSAYAASTTEAELEYDLDRFNNTTDRLFAVWCSSGKSPISAFKCSLGCSVADVVEAAERRSTA